MQTYLIFDDNNFQPDLSIRALKVERKASKE